MCKYESLKILNEFKIFLLKKKQFFFLESVTNYSENFTTNHFFRLNFLQHERFNICIIYIIRKRLHRPKI